ncbi:MAG TPA: trypsin-like serine protease [Gemmatimonadaceae bacterium]|nr:trypsin-like serine protease [Gemmatimonadaceae bacterium]
MRITTSAALTLIAFCAAACGQDPHSKAITAPRDGSSFIINGTPTGNNGYANVGALLFDFDQNGIINGDDALCSGSLIASTVFLTAAHCVSFFPANAQLYVSFNADLYDPNLKVIAASGFHFDPLFGHDLGDLHDLGVIILPAAQTGGITPLQLPTAGLLNGLAAKGGLVGRLFVNVGYGVDATQRAVPRFTFDGVRKSSKSLFQALEPAWLWLSMNQNRTGQGGDCYGDSGSPKFFDGNTSLIVATVTSGDNVCRATSRDYRLDTPSARTFLGNFVSLP